MKERREDEEEEGEQVPGCAPERGCSVNVKLFKFVCFLFVFSCMRLIKLVEEEKRERKIYKESGKERGSNLQWQRLASPPAKMLVAQTTRPVRETHPHQNVVYYKG